MYTITVEDAEAIVAGIKDNLVSDAFDIKERSINTKGNQIIMELNDIIRDAKAISWYSGYYPKINLSESIAADIRRFKEMTC